MKFAAAWDKWVVIGWMVLVLADDVRRAVPYVHWMATLLAGFLLLPLLVSSWRRPGFPARRPAWLLVIAVSVPALYGAQFGYSLAESAKLAIILILGTAAFAGGNRLAEYAFRGFIAAVIANLILLLGGAVGLGTAAVMTGFTRWGTVLDYPGVLWRVGITVGVYSAYCAIRMKSLKYAGLLAGSAALVYFDGARTGILLFLLVPVFTLIVIAWEAGRLRMAIAGSAAAVALGFFVLHFGGELLNSNAQSDTGAERVSQLAGSLQQAGIGGLGAADLIRFQMLQDAQAAIRAHPWLGTGFESTKTDTIVGPMVIHMTYMQVWADLGLLGFIAFSWLMLDWLGWIRRVPQRIRRLAAPQERAIYYNAIFLLIVYAITALFHPLSTEWSQWVMFIVPYAMLWRLLSPRLTPEGE
ncbi:MAG: O-antigen ligase family protein [Acidobacteria bacterium]|nr:O-antigen ligase family protein [Acidobacteriota bacterium]